MLSLTLLAALCALGSAMAHAVMSLLTKRSGDTLVFRSVMFIFSGLFALPVIAVYGVPRLEVWPFILASAGFMWVFNLMMISAFERGDMNLVYPVMRGAAPALIGVVAWIALGEPLGVWAMLGLAISCAALLAFAWPEKGGTPKASALGFALVSATMTAGYTVVDAAGVRLADNIIMYAAWIYVMSMLTVTVTAILRRGWTRYVTLARVEWRAAFWGSIGGIASYLLALWAYSNAPVAPMAALRETSIVFGAILAALILKEGFGRRRIVLALLLAGGLAILQLAG